MRLLVGLGLLGRVLLRARVAQQLVEGGERELAFGLEVVDRGRCREPCAEAGAEIGSEAAPEVAGQVDARVDGRRVGRDERVVVGRVDVLVLAEPPPRHVVAADGHVDRLEAEVGQITGVQVVRDRIRSGIGLVGGLAAAAGLRLGSGLLRRGSRLEEVAVEVAEAMWNPVRRRPGEDEEAEEQHQRPRRHPRRPDRRWRAVARRAASRRRRRPSAGRRRPASGCGLSLATWNSAAADTTSRAEPMPIRPLSCTDAGWRKSQSARIARNTGSPTATWPNRPPNVYCSIVTTTAFVRRNHSAAPPAIASSSSTKGTPSRRCSF